VTSYTLHIEFEGTCFQ